MAVDEDSGVVLAYWNHLTYKGMHNTSRDLVAPPLFDYMAGRPPLVPLVAPIAPAGSALGVIRGNSVLQFEIPFDAVVEVLINNTDGGDHPIHFHGYVFWIVATSEYPDTETIYAGDGGYQRRDVVSVAANGFCADLARLVF